MDQTEKRDSIADLREGETTELIERSSAGGEMTESTLQISTSGEDEGTESTGRTSISLPKLYERYHSPAEVVLPYSLSARDKNWLQLYFESRFKKSLSNMDFPWLLVMGSSIVGATGAAVVILLFGAFSMAFAPAAAVALSVFGSFPILFAVIAPLIYPISVLVNLRMGWGSNWSRTLLGPTHIGLTDSGFKLYVRGFFFYCYPNLAIWPEVFGVDLISDRLYDSIALRFVYQTGFGRAPIQLPLSGFASAEDLHFVLSRFSELVDPANQGNFLKEMAALKFEPIIKAFEEGSLGTLEQKLLLNNASKLNVGIDVQDG